MKCTCGLLTGVCPIHPYGMIRACRLRTRAGEITRGGAIREGGRINVDRIRRSGSQSQGRTAGS